MLTARREEEDEVKGQTSKLHGHAHVTQFPLQTLGISITKCTDVELQESREGASRPTWLGPCSPTPHLSFFPTARSGMAARSPLSQSHAQSSDSEDSDHEDVAGKLGELNIAETEIDVESLNPLSPEVICKQATINIGMATSPSTESAREQRRKKGRAKRRRARARGEPRSSQPRGTRRAYELFFPAS